jgi:hypothetical protein
VGEVLTSEYLFADTGKDLHIGYRCDDAFQRAELRIDSQGQQHQEEEYGPERSQRELINSFGADDEGQTRPGGCLNGRKKKRKSLNFPSISFDW